MTQKQENFWRIWGTPISCLLGFIGLCWTVSVTVAGVVGKKITQLDNVTVLANQNHNDITSMKEEGSKRRGDRDSWDRKQDLSISSCTLNITRLLDKQGMDWE